MGFFGVGVWHPKHHENIGTLMRSAHAFGAAFVFTVGARFQRQASDTVGAWTKLPVYCYADMDDLIAHLPHSCPLVGVEMSERAFALPDFTHPARACYLLGAEDHGLSPAITERCHRLVSIPGASECLNVATAGSIVMYDRLARGQVAAAPRAAGEGGSGAK